MPRAAGAARRAGRAVRAGVLAGGRAVQIRTFHGWFAQLLRSAPLAAARRGSACRPDCS